MNKVGIEKMNLYGTSMYLEQKDLAIARGLDPEAVVADYLIDTRSLNPVWEDTVTMGANAALSMLTEEDKASIGLLVVGTEGSVDHGKPISTNIHKALGLGPNVRNYETKFACYSGGAAMDAAINYVGSGFNHGKKALVVCADFSRMHLGAKHEFVMGGVSAAYLISDKPKIVEFEAGKKGTWTTDIYDTFRPTARVEMGNNEVSLFSYMDAVQGAYEDYLRNNPDTVDFDTYFKYIIYHTPFAGITFQAHRTLTRLFAPKKKPELQADFDARVFPALRYARRVGSCYAGSNFAGLASVIMGDPSLKEGDRLGFFAYGSGAIGEFYSATVCKGALDVIKAMKIDDALNARRRVTVAEYEMVEKLRDKNIENGDWVPDFSILDNWYDKHYKGSGLLVLKEVKDYYRSYEIA